MYQRIAASVIYLNTRHQETFIYILYFRFLNKSNYSVLNKGYNQNYLLSWGYDLYIVPGD